MHRDYHQFLHNLNIEGHARDKRMKFYHYVWLNGVFTEVVYNDSVKKDHFIYRPITGENMNSKDYAAFVNSIDFTADKRFEEGVVHHVLSICSEAGEIAGKVTKQYYRNAQNGYSEFRDKLVDETSDVLFHLVALCNTYGITIEELASYNHKKLTDRVKRGVLVGEGDAR